MALSAVGQARTSETKRLVSSAAGPVALLLEVQRLSGAIEIAVPATPTFAQFARSEPDAYSARCEFFNQQLSKRSPSSSTISVGKAVENRCNPTVTQGGGGLPENRSVLSPI